MCPSLVPVRMQGHQASLLVLAPVLPVPGYGNGACRGMGSLGGSLGGMWKIGRWGRLAVAVAHARASLAGGMMTGMRADTRAGMTMITQRMITSMMDTHHHAMGSASGTRMCLMTTTMIDRHLEAEPSGLHMTGILIMIGSITLSKVLTVVLGLGPREGEELQSEVVDEGRNHLEAGAQLGSGSLDVGLVGWCVWQQVLIRH